MLTSPGRENQRHECTCTLGAAKTKRTIIFEVILHMYTKICHDHLVKIIIMIKINISKL